ncbi:MAG TPA: peptide chain release factor 1 [Archangium sp.]|uniref:peptide chain release factor 1 n=1 Tax=Archangium sp. TaxID=1872627 RepID=UPI002E2F50E7|nr:peptide chain release factor 1 [Archangium sp.]HEX5749698.1 peptide chain release factor 1 [Archangium sp.]
MIDKLEEVERKFERLTADLSNPDIISDTARLQRVSKERAGLEKLVEAFRAYRKVLADLKEVEAWLGSSDPDEKAYARESLPGLKAQRDEMEAELKILLLPKDPNDDKNVILEIRAGAGGDEAGLFAEEVMQMYLRYADRKGWKAEIMDMSAGGVGGVKDVSIMLSGDGVYSHLKYESGVHRVQRVPATETQGRIHTSAATVAVMPEADDTSDVVVNPADVRTDTYRASGAGGQHINKTDSAVRLTHIPTGIVVQCQDGRSQHGNRDVAWKRLRSKLYDFELRKRQEAQQKLEDTKTDVGWGHQIRSYVLDNSRIKDLRTNVEISNTQKVLDGDLDTFIEASLKQGL